MRRFVVVAVALALTAGSAFASKNRQELRQVLPDEQSESVLQLPEVEHISFGANGIPNFITGKLGRLPQGEHGAAALSFVRGMGRMVQATGREELAPTRVVHDEIGMVHVHMQQYYRGLPVVGADVAVHADANGEVRVINGRFAPIEGDLPVRSQLSAEHALESAAREAGIGTGVVLDAPALVYVIGDSDKPHLAWTARVQHEANGQLFIDQVYGDAISGGLVTSEGLIKTALNRKIYDGNHTNPDYPTLPGTLLFSEGASGSSDAAAWDCYVNFGYTYNYYKARFNRDSFDNAGAALIGTVHVGTNYVNAYWNGTQMVFGDGDGTNATYLSKALDVVAHELTHAVTDRTADLAYQNDSGALNEGMSDIFAAGTEVYKDGSVNSDTWKVGEDCWTPNTAGDALRYMNNPTADGASADYYPERNYASGCSPSYSNDYCGVHTNSGIANLAFYLLSQGGTHPRNKTTVQVPAITIQKAEQIFYRALTVYMTSSTNFEGGRNATAQAAADLYGGTSSAEYAAVQKAWDAVGVPGGAPVLPTQLTNGQVVSNLAASTGVWKHYYLTVPSGQSSLEIKISGGTGDADLYVKRGAQPTSSSYDYRPYLNGNNETVTVSNPVAGDWYISIYGYSTYSGVSLQATYTGSTPTPTLALALSPTSLSVAQGATGSTTATTTVGGGFNSAVSLSASGLPSGATASFNPTSIAAPGSGSSTLTVNGGTAATGTYSVTVTASGGGLTKTATLSLTITQGSSSVTTLSNGVPLSSQAASTGQWKYYKIAVPSSQTSLVVESSGGSGDADLYVKLGGTPTTSSYNGKSEGSTSTETVTISSPAAGDWYIGLYAYSSFSSVTIKATYSGSSGGGTMNESESNGSTSSADVVPASGTVVTGYIGSSTDNDYFKVTVPGYTTLTVDLVVPSTKDYDVRILNSSGTTLVTGQKGTGLAEHITYYNSSSSSRVFYIRVYGYNGAYSTSLPYTLTPTW